MVVPCAVVCLCALCALVVRLACWLVASSLVISLLACCWLTGNRLLLVVCVGGVGVEGGGVFWVGVLFGAVG